VVIKANDLRLGIHNGDRAVITRVDHRSQALELDCHGHRVTLDADFLHSATTRDEPTLLHGYAIAGHVAQGATVDRAYVLADPSLTGEWAYTAMSRGRHRNALYFSPERDDGRLEFAPQGLEERSSLEWLTTGLRSSSAASLAIDTGTPDLEREAAVKALDAARAERRRAERRRLAWRPSVRAEVDAAGQVEAAAAARVAELERTRAAGLRARAQPEQHADEIAGQRVTRLLERAELNRRRARERERDSGWDLER
jgi:hypothetical protein